MEEAVTQSNLVTQSDDLDVQYLFISSWYFRENLLNSNEEYVSYDVDSLFTSIPLGETIDFIVDDIYVRKKLGPFCKKSVFKKLLKKMCKGCTFLTDGRLIR